MTTPEVKAAPALLTVREAADALGCSMTNVYGLISNGALPVVRVGARKGYRIDPADVHEFIRTRKEARSGAISPRQTTRPKLRHIRVSQPRCERDRN